MAVVTLKSTMISNRDATPKVFTDAFIANGDMMEAEGYVAPVNGNSAASVYKMCSVPSNCRMSSLLMQCSALGSGATVDLGAYWPTFIPLGADLLASNAGAAIDSDFFATAVDVSAALAQADYVNESGTNTIAKQELPLWQALGLTADPGIELDICATVGVAIAANGFLSVKARYVKQ